MVPEFLKLKCGIFRKDPQNVASRATQYITESKESLSLLGVFISIAVKQKRGSKYVDAYDMLYNFKLIRRGVKT